MRIRSHLDNETHVRTPKSNELMSNYQYHPVQSSAAIRGNSAATSEIKGNVHWLDFGKDVTCRGSPGRYRGHKRRLLQNKICRHRYMSSRDHHVKQTNRRE
jgi:hypothetical protein